MCLDISALHQIDGKTGMYVAGLSNDGGGTSSSSMPYSRFDNEA